MASIKAHEADRSLARPDPAWRLFLFFGPDSGLVSERAAALARASVDDPEDAFQLVRLDGDAIASDPLRLADEANTIGLFGGRRVVRVSPTGKPLLAAVEPLLTTPSRDAIVVVEAGDLARNNPLRTACERSRHAVAVPCYGDAARDLGTIVDDMLREAGKTIERDARERLLGMLGANRQSSRREVEKLIVYAGEAPRITADNIEAVIDDAGAREQAALNDAVFAGDFAQADLALARLTAEGQDAGAILGGVMRHALALLRTRIATDQGKSWDEAKRSLRLPFPREKAAESALRRWSTEQLQEAVERLGEGVAAARRDSELARPLAGRTLIALTRAGRAPVRP